MKHSLTDIAGIGESTAALMSKHGIDSVKALRKVGAKKLMRVPGFGEKRAAAVLAAAKEMKGGDKVAEKEAKKAADRKPAKKTGKPEKKSKKTAKVKDKKANKKKDQKKKKKKKK